MARNIVICIDGTNDFAAQRPTHVFRLAQSLERSEGQVIYYDGGVGTLGDAGLLTDAKRAVLKTLDAAAATSIHRNVGEAYRFLMQNYKKDDRIFLFGFSRGAYAIRALAGMIRVFGLLHPSHENLVPFLWQAYRLIGKGESSKEAESKDRAADESTEKEEPEDSAWRAASRIRTAFGHRVTIHFLGAWDTVSTVGLIRLGTLPYTANLQSVERAMHAVSIDERRNMFPENLIKTDANHLECWFAGVHRDVGGGGNADALELSMIPYRWILDGAMESGLSIDEKKVERQKFPSPEPNALGKDNQNALIVAAFGVFGLFPMKWWSQEKGRFAGKWLNFVHRRPISTENTIHPSVRERLAGKGLDYHPKNLPAQPTFGIPEFPP